MRLKLCVDRFDEKGIRQPITGGKLPPTTMRWIWSMLDVLGVGLLSDQRSDGVHIDGDAISAPVTSTSRVEVRTS
jgi:hypothetical protein